MRFSTWSSITFARAGCVIALSLPVACTDAGGDGSAPAAGGSPGSGGVPTAAGGNAGSPNGSGGNPEPGGGGATNVDAGGSVNTGGAGGGGIPGSGGVPGSGGADNSPGDGGPGTGGAPSVGWSCPSGPHTSPSGALTAARISAVPPADDYVMGGGVMEGPVWLDGALYVSQFPYGNAPKSRIIRFTPPADVTVINAMAGTNGLAADANGNLVAGRHQDGSISRFALTDPSTPTVIAGSFESSRFNSPNDLTVRRDGNIYFTDPNYQAPTPQPQSATRVYRVSPSGEVTVVDASLDQPNGVTLSLDENTLYVSDPGNVFQYPVAADGTVGNRSQFAGGPSDGMGLDCAGNLYVTRDGAVLVLDGSGQEIARISVASEGGTTNVAFGGADHRTLYVTTLGNTQELHSVDLPLPGLPY